MVCSGFSDLLYCLNWTVRFFFFPTNNFSLSNTEFREIYVHFHSHGSLFCIPMKETSHLASFSSRNFSTRSLKSENSEVAYCNVSKETPWNDIPRGHSQRTFPEDIPRGTENKPSHSIPFQKYWVWQVQLNDPTVFVQLAPPLVQLLRSKAHSSISENNRKTLIRGRVKWITLKDYISFYTVFIFK